MRSQRRRGPSPSLVISCVALAVALSGSAYAVTALPRNSVGPAQLKKNAVTSAKVRNYSLRSIDFARGQIPAGPQGPVGLQGPPGQQGVQGVAGPKGDPGATNVVIRSADRSTAMNISTGVTASCLAGERATGGGGRFADGTFSTADVIYLSAPMGAGGVVAEPGEVPTRWTVFYKNGSTSTRTFRVYVVCAAP